MAKDQKPVSNEELCDCHMAKRCRQSPKKAGWSWGCVSALDSNGRTIWIVDAHRDDGKRFVVRADEQLTAFVELERQVLTVTFYLESIHGESVRDQWR